MSLDKILNLILFYLGWTACVVGAARGYPHLGPVVVGAVAVVRIFRAKDRRGELRLLGWTGVIGFAVDSALSGSGVLTFLTNRPGAWLSPPWMVALWINFAATLRSSLAWLSPRPFLGGLLGFFGGPLSYWAGERLGAIELAGAWSLAVLAVAWAFAVPCLFVLAKRRSGYFRT